MTLKYLMIRPLVIAATMATVQPSSGVSQHTNFEKSDVRTESSEKPNARTSITATGISRLAPSAQGELQRARMAIARVAHRPHPQRTPRDYSALLTLFDIAETRTEAEFHALVRQLPVTVTRSPTNTGSHSTVTFSHRNGRSVTYSIGNRQSSTKALLNSAESMASGHTDMPQMSGPFVGQDEEYAIPTFGDCDYYDPDDDIYYVDDCLTQQEFEDYTILQLAIQEEVDESQAEVAEAHAFIELCEETRGDGPLEEVQDDLDILGCPAIASSPFAIIDPDAMHDPSHLVSPSGAEPDMYCTDVSGAIREGCGAKALAAAGSYITWAVKATKFGRALWARAAAATVGEYVALVGVTAIAVATAYEYVDCAYFGEPEQPAPN